MRMVSFVISSTMGSFCLSSQFLTFKPVSHFRGVYYVLSPPASCHQYNDFSKVFGLLERSLTSNSPTEQAKKIKPLILSSFYSEQCTRAPFQRPSLEMTSFRVRQGKYCSTPTLTSHQNPSRAIKSPPPESALLAVESISPVKEIAKSKIPHPAVQESRDVRELRGRP